MKKIYYVQESSSQWPHSVNLISTNVIAALNEHGCLVRLGNTKFFLKVLFKDRYNHVIKLQLISSLLWC